MSQYTSDTFTFNCGNDHSLTEPCDGAHTVRVEAHLSSDTVVIYVDGESLVLSDTGYWVLRDAMAQMESRWSGGKK